MSLKRYVAPLRLEVGASTRLRLAVFAAHAGVVITLPLITMFDAYLKLLICAAVQVNGVVIWGRRSELCGKRLILIFNNGKWYWQNTRAQLPVTLLTSSYVTPHLVILNFCETETDRHRSVVLPGDNCDREGLRRLRVILKTTSQESLSAS